MKIIFFTGEFTEGGAERVISVLTNELVKRGFDVEILKYLDSENFYTVNDSIKITSVIGNTRTDNKFTNLKWMHNYFKNNGDLIISFLASWNIMALLAVNGSKPIIVADRNDPNKIPTNKAIRKLRDYLYTKADGVVLQTIRNKNYFAKAVQDKSVVIANPIDLGEYEGKALTVKKENIIVSVGRLKKQKNQELLINVFESIYKKHPEYKLVIYGEGDQRKPLEDLIDSLDLKNKVILAGNRKDVFNKILPAKAFVLSSDYEGMPNALIEAMCLGLPSISTKVSGTEEIIKDGENGLLVDIGNKSQMEKAILKVIEDEKYANSMAKEATKLASELKIDKIANEWVRYIEEIYNKKHVVR